MFSHVTCFLKQRLENVIVTYFSANVLKWTEKYDGKQFSKITARSSKIAGKIPSNFFLLVRTDILMIK